MYLCMCAVLKSNMRTWRTRQRLPGMVPPYCAGLGGKTGGRSVGRAGGQSDGHYIKIPYFEYIIIN